MASSDDVLETRGSRDGPWTDLSTSSQDAVEVEGG